MRLESVYNSANKVKKLYNNLQINYLRTKEN